MSQSGSHADADHNLRYPVRIRTHARRTIPKTGRVAAACPYRGPAAKRLNSITSAAAAIHRVLAKITRPSQRAAANRAWSIDAVDTGFPVDVSSCLRNTNESRGNENAVHGVTGG